MNKKNIRMNYAKRLIFIITNADKKQCRSSKNQIVKGFDASGFYLNLITLYREDPLSTLHQFIFLKED